MQFFSQFHTTSLFQKQGSWDFPIDDYIVVEVRYTTSNTLYHLSHIVQNALSTCSLKAIQGCSEAIRTSKIDNYNHQGIVLETHNLCEAASDSSCNRSYFIRQSLHSVAKLCTALQNSRVGYELRQDLFMKMFLEICAWCCWRAEERGRNHVIPTID